MKNQLLELLRGVICVSLPTDTARRENASRELAQFGVAAWEWQDGVFADSPEVIDVILAGKVRFSPPCFRCEKEDCTCENNFLTFPQIAVSLAYRHLWERIVRNSEGGEEVIEMSGTELVAFSLVHCRPDRQTHSWLGSSASNLYKTSCLKSLPFPTSVGPSGDVLWALMNSATVSATFCGRRCGRFVVHESDSSGPSVRDADVSSVYTKAWVEARDWLLQNLDGVGSGVEVRHLFEKMLDDQITLAEKIVRLRRRRKELADLKAYLHEVRERIPRRLRRFVFPASATRVQSVKPE